MSDNKKESLGLNYTTHAIESLEKQFTAINMHPMSIGPFNNILKLLDSSIKFILPDKGNLLDDSLSIENIKQEWVDLTKLPYPITTFEIPFSSEGNEPLKKNEVESSKRIMLCWDVNSQNEIVQAINYDFIKASPSNIKTLEYIQNQQGFCFLVIAYIDHAKAWSFNPMVLFFSYENEIRNHNGRQSLLTTSFNIFPDFAAITAHQFYEGSIDALSQGTTTDSLAEIIATIQACCVLNCDNIETVDLLPSQKVNKKRLSKGKKPFYSYKILELTSESSQLRSALSGNVVNGSTKRTHLRRGHLRRYKNGKVTWVRNSIVGANKSLQIGAVEKTYSIK